jgi:hypothetical protein
MFTALVALCDQIDHLDRFIRKVTGISKASASSFRDTTTRQLKRRPTPKGVTDIETDFLVSRPSGTITLQRINQARVT